MIAASLTDAAGALTSHPREPKGPAPMSLNTSSTGRAAPTAMPDRSTEQMMPTSVASDVIAGLIKKHGVQHTQLCRLASSPDYPVGDRRLYRVLNNRSQTVSIHLVDAVLTALGEQAMWHDAPLAQYLEDEAA